MPISYATAVNMMQNGSAIPAALAPYQNLPGFSFQSSGIGLFTVTVPRVVGWNTTYDGPGDTRGTANPVISGSNTYTFSVSWSAFGQQDGQDGKPKPTTRGTPTPNPTPQPAPKSTCFTFKDLFNLPKVRSLFDEAWRATEKSGNENGGWLFLEADINKVHAYIHTEGTRTSGPTDEHEQFDEVVKELKTQGRKAVFIVDFHTHPRGTPYPSQDDVANIDTPAKRIASPRRDAVGVIIYGSGKYSFYDNAGEIISSSENGQITRGRRLNDCLPYY